MSADTIVPGYANPQNLNRFSYVLNHPVRYTDPTWHWICEICPGEGGDLPDSGDDGTGTTGGGSGDTGDNHHRSPGEPDPIPPVVPPVDMPPVVLLPPIDIGVPIIISPITSPVSAIEDGYCKSLRKEYENKLDQVRSLVDKIRELQKAKEKASPDRKVEIDIQIYYLAMQQVDLLKEAQKIKLFAKNIQCDMSKWS